MSTLDDNFKLDIWFVNLAIRKAFTAHEVKIDDITWNPHRTGQASDQFNIHAIQVTIGSWREIIYRIETRDIKNYSAGIKRHNIDQRINELVEKYLHYASDRPNRSSGKHPGFDSLHQPR